MTIIFAIDNFRVICKENHCSQTFSRSRKQAKKQKKQKQTTMENNTYSKNSLLRPLSKAAAVIVGFSAFFGSVAPAHSSSWQNSVPPVPATYPYFIQSAAYGADYVLQATQDPYWSGSRYVPACNKVALTPFVDNDPWREWWISRAPDGDIYIYNRATGQPLQSTWDQYYGDGGRPVPGCNKVALTQWGNSPNQQEWIAEGVGNGTYVFANWANSQFLHATQNPYLQTSTTTYLYGWAYEVCGTPYSWGPNDPNVQWYAHIAPY
jgi:hypothetical protein